MKPLPFSITDVRQFNIMMRKVRIARKRKMVFHGSPKRQKVLKPKRAKHDALHMREKSRSLVFASPRFEIAVIHALLPVGQRRWRVLGSKTTIEIPMGGLKPKKAGGFIHAFPDGQHLIGNKDQRGSSTSVRPRTIIRVPTRALEILVLMKRVLPRMSPAVQEEVRRRISAQ
jgi:hypothetical protein